MVQGFGRAREYVEFVTRSDPESNSIDGGGRGSKDYFKVSAQTGYFVDSSCRKFFSSRQYPLVL